MRRFLSFLLVMLVCSSGFAADSKPTPRIEYGPVAVEITPLVADVPQKGDNIHWILESKKINVGVDTTSIKEENGTKSALVVFVFNPEYAPAPGIAVMSGRMVVDCKAHTIQAINVTTMDENLQIIEDTKPIAGTAATPTGKVSEAAYDVVCGIPLPVRPMQAPDPMLMDQLQQYEL